MERRDNGSDRIETLKGDVRDAADEAKHRVKAGAEKVKRGAEGDAMPLGDRLASHVKEMGHDLKADLDKANREARDREAHDKGV